MYKYNVYTGTYIIVKLQNISPKIFAMFENWTSQRYKNFQNLTSCKYIVAHGLRRPREEIAFTARPKIHSHSQFFNIFCLPHQPKFSGIFDLCLHWVSVILTVAPSLNTQSCIRGLLGVRDFCFWAV